MAFMQEKDWVVHGVEFSTKPPNLYNLDIFYGTLKEANFPSGCFDLVTMWAVLEHVYNPLDMLREIQRILKPNGKLLVAVPNFKSIPAILMRHDDVPRHITMFTENTLKNILSASGLELNRVDFNSDLYGGKNRGLINYLTKLVFGENIEDILAQNRSVDRWYQFSSYLNGRKSNFMLRIDNLDIAVTPYLDRWFDRFGLGFIMIAEASNIIGNISS
jgi:SAM-dependent methyltransferase